MQQLEQRLHRQIIKSRPYFEEKSLCNEQLANQKERVEVLQTQVAAVKGAYAASLKELERISEEIHCKRNKNKQTEAEQEPPQGPREPGVGAELEPVFCESSVPTDGTTNEPQQSTEKSSELLSNVNPVEVQNEAVTERKSLQSSPAKVNSPTPRSPAARPNLTPLPLLDNLTHLKNTIESPMANAMLGLPGSSDISKKSNMLEDDFGKVAKTSSENEEAYNHVLLNHLMENYESELDRCDMNSLSGMSVATGSSAVSEKDETECYLEEVSC